jgi:CheY-like chemotaxis protein
MSPAFFDGLHSTFILLACSGCLLQSTILIVPGTLIMSAAYILVVDDDELTLTLMTCFLQSLGATVLTAHDGEAALRIMADYEGQIGMVITDLAMPRMSGITYAETMRAVPAYDHIPLIALTARVGIEITEKAIQAGFTTIIFKPFEPRKMREMLVEYGLAGTAS